MKISNFRKRHGLVFDWNGDSLIVVTIRQVHWFIGTYAYVDVIGIVDPEDHLWQCLTITCHLKIKHFSLIRVGDIPPHIADAILVELEGEDTAI